jgi:hypothetical protein
MWRGATDRSSFFVLIALVWALVGCDEGAGKGVSLPGKVGPSGEMVVVCSSTEWNGPIGKRVREIFERPFPLLPQLEPSFDLQQLDREAFDRFWKPHRNVVVIDVGDRVDTQTPSVAIYRDKYANGQLYVHAKARSEEELAAAIAGRAEELASLFAAEEVERYRQLILLDENEVARREIGELLGIGLTLPRDSRIVKTGKDFVWVDRQMTRLKGGDNHDVQQGWFITTEPYTSDQQFLLPHRLHVRDSLLARYVPGPTDGSYMTTEMRSVPRLEELAFKGKYAAEIRGLWRMENDYMGGPFCSLTVYDSTRARLVTVEGYAYAPYFDKREYVRQIEAVVRSLEFLP